METSSTLCLATLASGTDQLDINLPFVAASGLGLPRNAAIGLFVIGPTVGWIARAIEQYESGIPIRPRARYMSPRPEEALEST